MLRAIVIDDEKTSRDTLINMINRYCNNIDVIDKADGFVNGIESIKNNKPDLVFLDIQMADGSGFKLLETIKDINFDVIFTTAFDQYAIKAIKYSALDYLLKPIVPDELKSAVEKAELKKHSGNVNHLKILFKNLTATDNEERQIALSTMQGIYIFKLDEIICCEADGCYSTIYVIDDKKILITRPLKELEELIDDTNFIRTHKSFLVNKKHIKNYLRADGGSLILSNKMEVPISRRKKDYINQLFNK
jgi:two-component system, LytTR family, response regulator